MIVLVSYSDVGEWQFTWQEALKWLRNEREIVTSLDHPFIGKAFLDDCRDRASESIVLERYCVDLMEYIDKCGPEVSPYSNEVV